MIDKIYIFVKYCSRAVIVCVLYASEWCDVMLRGKVWGNFFFKLCKLVVWHGLEYILVLVGGAGGGGGDWYLPYGV